MKRSKNKNLRLDQYIQLKRRIFRRNGLCILLFCSILLFSCKKFIELDPPLTSVNSANVYSNDASAIAVLTDIYRALSQENGFVGGAGGLGGQYILSGLSADELTLYSTSYGELTSFYQNDITINTGDAYWSSAYNHIFVTNAALEGLAASSLLTPAVKQVLVGEAKFMRAFLYFYLVNLYGDVPMPLSTDYKVNTQLPRSSKETVYTQIIADLKDAQSLLSSDYLNNDLRTITTIERVRPNKWAATALLARTYLYIKDYNNAATQATSLIDNNNYTVAGISLNNVFLKNSRETIWALQPVENGNNSNTGAGRLFILPSTGVDDFSYPIGLSKNITDSFEIGDARKDSWVRNVITPSSEVYYYSYKYKVGNVESPTQEYTIVFRLAEQYLIRAEARAQLNDISGATADLNVIRTRARAAITSGVPDPLPDLSESLSQHETLIAVERERRSELFTEWGHRWLDLKRMPGLLNPAKSRLDEIMTSITLEKGGRGWESYKSLLPIPKEELGTNPSITGHQNPGY